MYKKFLTKSNLILLGIIILAAFLRLYRIRDYLTFLGDEGRDVLVAYNILHGHLTLLGPTSSVGGFFLGPIYYYFMAPFLWIFQYDPVGPAVMIAILGIATVWLVYKIGSEFFGTKAGLIASFLYSISPLVISYSRSSWNPNPMPFFTLLTLYFLYKAEVLQNLPGKTRAFLNGKPMLLLIVVGILYGIDLQLHYIEVFVGVMIVTYVMLAKVVLGLNPSKLGHLRLKGSILGKKIIGILKDYLYIFLGFLIGYSPFLLFEVRHGFPNIRSILNFIFLSKETGPGPGFLSTIWNVFFRIFGRLVGNFLPPEQIDLFNNKPLLNAWYFGIVTLALLSVGALFYLVRKNKKDKIKLFQYGLISVWLFLGIFFFGFYKKAIYDYYFEFLYPVPFLLVGNLISIGLEKGKLIKIISIILLIGLFAINIQGVPFRYEPNRQLQQVETISKFALDQTNNKPFNFALITGGNSDHAYRYFFTIWDHPPVTIQFPGVDPRRTSVTDQLLIVCETLPCSPLGNSLWEVAGFGQAEIAGHWTVSVVEGYKLVPYK